MGKTCYFVKQLLFCPFIDKNLSIFRWFPFHVFYTGFLRYNLFGIFDTLFNVFFTLFIITIIGRGTDKSAYNLEDIFLALLLYKSSTVIFTRPAPRGGRVESLSRSGCLFVCLSVCLCVCLKDLGTKLSPG